MKILVLNCGSSSLKYKLFDMTTNEILARGQADRIGMPASLFLHTLEGRESFLSEDSLGSHGEAVNALLEILAGQRSGMSGGFWEIAAVGHRVVHGGEHFRSSVLIDASVRERLDACSKLAPLHNPPSLVGIDVCTARMPGVPQAAVFDTAFHQTMPDYAYTYAIPHRYYREDHVRRYGFHGISHRYVAMRAAKILERRFTDLRLITCHLGNGASLCAVAGGKSMDTSMGFTPLSGIVMGTRCGDIDPAVVSFLADKEGLPLSSVIDLLNRDSGVLGISGLSQDFRDLESAAQRGHEPSRLALSVFAYSVARGIGSLIPAAGGLDALVFTAGIGEHSPFARRLICSHLAGLGIVVDDGRNTRDLMEGEISPADAAVKVLIVPTDEEKMIAWETKNVLEKSRTSEYSKEMEEL